MPLVLVMMSSTSVRIRKRFHATKTRAKKLILFRGYASCIGLLEWGWSGLELLKSTLNGKNFIRKLSWSISSLFSAIYL